MVRTAIEVLHQPQRSARAVRPLVVHLVHQAMDDEHPVPVFLWRVQVGRLRRKLEEDPQNPTLIKTVRGSGYIFTPTVEMS